MHAPMPVSVLLLSAWVAGGTAVALAQESQELTGSAGSAVELRIGAVVASYNGQRFDQRLTSLRRQFKSLFRYSSYRLVAEERRRVEWRREAEFSLPGGRYLMVIPREYRDGRVSLNVMLVQGTRPLVNTILALRNRGTFLVGGPQHKEGVLIIAIGARTTR